MNNFLSFSFGSSATPKTIKYLIIFTSLISILSAGIQEVFNIFDIFPGPQNLLSLSWWGLYHWYLWQPLTFLFIQDPSAAHTSFYFFVILFFKMYVLWVVGSTVLQALGNLSFVRLYFFGGMFAGILSLLSMSITGQYEMIGGSSAALLMIVTVWAMAFPETEVLILSVLPAKTKWIVAAIVSIVLFTTLTEWNLSLFFLYVFAIAVGYGYALLVRGWHSPFAITAGFDVWMSRMGLKFRHKVPRWMDQKEPAGAPPKGDGKIIDITSGQPIQNDDLFVDAMLTKISKSGESSLSWSEKRRLHQISEDKIRNKKL